MEPLPMEDTATDVIGKAQRGLRISDDELARRADLRLGEVQAVKSGAGSEPALRQIAPVLQLNAQALIDVASGWHPEPVGELKGVKSFTTLMHGNGRVNSYIVWDLQSRNAVAFDTGTDATAMIQFAADRQMRLQMALITHSHGDHIAALAQLIAATDLRAFVNKTEEFPGSQTFEPGHNFRCGNLIISTKPTHGHSRGGVTYIVHGLPQPVAFVGDALFAGSIGGGFSSYRDALRTCAEHILTLPGNTVLCPGHGPMTTVAEERRHNPFFPECEPVVQLHPVAVSQGQALE